MPESKSWMQRAVDNARVDCPFGSEELTGFIRSVRRKMKKAGLEGSELAGLKAELDMYEKRLDACRNYAKRAIELEAKLCRRASRGRAGAIAAIAALRDREPKWRRRKSECSLSCCTLRLPQPRH